MLIKNNMPVFAAAVIFFMLGGCDNKSSQNSVAPLKVQSTKCSLDLINGDGGAVTYADGAVVSFSGWAVDSTTNTVPPLLNIVLTGTNEKFFVFVGAARVDRPDLVKGFKQDAFLKAGFTLKADVSKLERDTYSISLQMPTDNSLIECQTKKTLVLK
ncbi:hypothetical protein [Aquipseudomonas alcaligenes]|uniref:hypothetical protein n=1 Tax=Aquipseudomonas alcaligenes TaxID=43263 RepID=UPI0036507B94